MAYLGAPISEEVSPQVTSRVKGKHWEDVAQTELDELEEPAATDEMEETNVRAASALDSLETAIIMYGYIQTRD